MDAAGGNGGGSAPRYGKLRIDTTACQVTFADTPIHLRRQEYALLVHLAHAPTRVYSKDELLREVWGFCSRGTTRTVTTHVSRLRQALALAGAEGWVSSVWGVGYRLAPKAHRRLRVLPGGRCDSAKNASGSATTWFRRSTANQSRKPAHFQKSSTRCRAG